MTEDLAPFFANFAVDATVNGQAVRGIFDNGFALGAVGIGMAGTQPTLRLRTADVTADPVGQAVSVNAVAYTVAAHEPDGTGVSVLMLERA
jgi:hypothetical protein